MHGKSVIHFYPVDGYINLPRPSYSSNVFFMCKVKVVCAKTKEVKRGKLLCKTLTTSAAGHETFALDTGTSFADIAPETSSLLQYY